MLAVIKQEIIDHAGEMLDRKELGLPYTGEYEAILKTLRLTFICALTSRSMVINGTSNTLDGMRQKHFIGDMPHPSVNHTQVVLTYDGVK